MSDGTPPITFPHGATPPTTPGALLVSNHAVWPRLLAIGCAVAGVGGALMAIAAIGYPAFSRWLVGQLPPGGTDDISGSLAYYPWPDRVIEMLTLGVSVWLLTLTRGVWRREPGPIRRLAWWCAAKVALELINLGLLWMQASAHFGTRTDMGEGGSLAAAIGFTAFAAGVGLVWPLVMLIWLVLPGTRRSVRRWSA